ncbi:MAG: PfkB family carbohydrate kinase, partial [Hyphomicrobium sp.]
LGAGGFELSLTRFFAGLHKAGPRWVVVTDGKNGAYLSTPSGAVHCPAPPATVVGTAGAGDAFNATLSACIAGSMPAEEAIMAAAINAASVVGHLDTQTGLLRRTDLAARLAAMRDAMNLTQWPA